MRSALWKTASSKFRERYGVPEDMKPWTGRKQFQARGIRLTERICDILDCAAIRTCAEKGLSLEEMSCPRKVESAMAGWRVDVSQSLDRLKLSGPGKPLQTFTTSTQVYLYAQDRILLPEEMLLLHGQSTRPRSAAGVSQELHRQHAANGMALPCLGMLVWALFLLKQFPEASRRPEVFHRCSHGA